MNITAELRQALAENSLPLEVTDGQRTYYLISDEQYRKMKAVLEGEEIDPSFFEFDDEDFDPRPADAGR